MAILRIDAVLQETGERSKTSIYNRVKEGVFTKPVPIGALRHFVWNPTVTMTPGRRARWACVQGAFRPVHMSTGRV